MASTPVPNSISASKLKILHAAAAVTQSAGASNLTLERIAEEAGISKGGLLYHYPNKRALLAGMLEYMMAPLQTLFAAASAGDAVALDFVLLNNTQSPEDRAIAQVLLAAAAEDPELLSPARAMFGQWLALATKQSQSTTVLLLASEGLRFLDLLDLLPKGTSPKSLLKVLNRVAESANTAGETA